MDRATLVGPIVWEARLDRSAQKKLLVFVNAFPSLGSVFSLQFKVRELSNSALMFLGVCSNSKPLFEVGSNGPHRALTKNSYQVLRLKSIALLGGDQN